MRALRRFIDRPVLAGVLAVLMVLAGLVAMRVLPVSEYPEVVPPTIVVRAAFPGADPATLSETVASPLEEQINGVDRMLYLSSQATADGVVTLTVTFALGTDPDLAQVQVQNRVAQALPRLPATVRQIGVTTQKSSPDLTMVVHLVSPDGRYDMTYLRNFAVLQVRDQLARLEGVGQALLFGAGDYAMRVWIDPDRAATLGLGAADIVGAIRRQNIEVAAGSVGSAPTPAGVDRSLALVARGRLADAEQFGAMVIRGEADGRLVRLRDVARIELASADYGLRALLDNEPAVAIAIVQAPGSNALDVSTRVRAEIARLQETFPAGVEPRIVYDPTQYVRLSIRGVVQTLAEAVLLVVIVVVLFLQSWRASLIPLLAVPVSIVGTLAVMHAAGFSINTLSLFGLVLAVGIVVDDAIVVVENVERHLHDGLSPRDAARRAMREVSGPIVAITMVLAAVFVPIAFATGLSGQFYRQFALTIAISTALSAINSLTLSPALAARLLRPTGAPKDALQRRLDALFGRGFAAFERRFGRFTSGYGRLLGRVLPRRALLLGSYVALTAAAGVLLWRSPAGFVPQQDKDYLVAIAQLPDGATIDRTEALVRRLGAQGLDVPGVRHAVQFPGLSINGFVNAPNAAVIFFLLDPADERTDADRSAGAIAGRLNGLFAGEQGGFVAVFPPPPVAGLGAIGGFKAQLEDRGNLGPAALQAATDSLLARARQSPEFAGVFTSLTSNVPQLHAEIDRERATQLGLTLDDVATTLQVYLGSAYVNDVSLFGRTYRVVAQADAPFRASAGDVGRLEARAADGTMVPLASVLRVDESRGADRGFRYNGYPSADINGLPAPGTSTGAAQRRLEQLAAEVLPRSIVLEWTDLAYQERLAGSSAVWLFPLTVLLAFLVLAAQYESWRLPMAVLLIVPMTAFSALFGLRLAGGEWNVFTQIGLVVLTGLASKNAILVVEFARELEARGWTPIAAALEAAKLRVRPIIMTSAAFVFGVAPLVVSTGAGAEMRRAVGLVVFAGMIGVTLFGLVFTPLFYALLQSRRAATAASTSSAAGVAGSAEVTHA